MLSDFTETPLPLALFELLLLLDEISLWVVIFFLPLAADFPEGNEYYEEVFSSSFNPNFYLARSGVSSVSTGMVLAIIGMSVNSEVKLGFLGGLSCLNSSRSKSPWADSSTDWVI